MDDPVRLILALASLVFSCVFHECAHVWVALKMGDTTGRDLGRLTLNPAPHIDLFWTVLLPVFSYFTMGFAFGGPKPAPVNTHNMRDPAFGGVLSALAGPGSNLLLAGIGVTIHFLIFTINPGLVPADSINGYFFMNFLLINVVLAVANLIPVPPLDGSRFLHYMIGKPMDPIMNFIERSGWITALPILFAFQVIFPRIFPPFFVLVYQLLASLFPGEYVSQLFETYNG